MVVKIHSNLLKKSLKYISGLILGLSIYLFFVELFNNILADYDLWGYLCFGRVFWEDGFFPYRDMFAYTPTQPLWVYHEWFTGVVFYSLTKYLGPASLQLLRYSLAILTIYLIYSTALKRGGNSLTTAIIIIPTILLISFGYVPVRAQIFTFFFFILTLYILEYTKKTGNRSVLWWLPLIQIFWCNFHGGFVSGIGLIFLYALGEGLARNKNAIIYLRWGIVSLLATLINPYGIKYWIYTIQAVSMPRPEITEWHSVLTALKSSPHIFPVYLFLVMSLIILLAFLFRRKKDLTDLLVIAVMICLGASHIRHGVLLGLVFGAYLPVVFSEYVDEWNANHRSFIFSSLFLPVSLCALLATSYFSFYPLKQISFIPTFRILALSDYYPTDAIHWLKANNIQGNILPHFEWGEYLIWSYYPACRVAMDGRYETVYKDNVHKEYFDFLFGRYGWDIFLKKYPHDIVMLKAGTKTHTLMIHERDWQMVYKDHLSVVFMKK